MSIKAIAALFVACFLAACSGAGSEDTDSFTLSGDLVNGREAQKAYLYKFLSEYGKIELLDTSSVRNGKFQFDGSCEEPVEAFVKLDTCKDVFGFVLSNAGFRMSIGKNSYVVTGTPANDRLSVLVMRQHLAVNNRIALQKEYSRMVADSTLTKQAEDSLLGIYRSQSADLQSAVYGTVVDSLATNRALSTLVYRMLYFTLSPSQADSVTSLFGNRL